MNRPLIYFALFLLAALFLLGTGAVRSLPQAGTLSIATPSASRDVSPLITNNAPANLLPTVTPTPFRPPTATPYLSPTPTVEVELYPMATPYPFDLDRIVRQGITYTERTSAGFGHFGFNDISPCLCQSPENCSREIEAYLLGGGLEGVVRGDQCLSIELPNHRIVTFKDVRANTTSVIYHYAKHLPEINYHLLHMGFWEGSEYLLVNGTTGAFTRLSDHPVFSPDHRRFTLVTYGTFVQIWSLEEDGPRYEQGWQVAHLPWEFEMPSAVITWEGTDRFQVHWPIPQGFASPPTAPGDVTVSLKGDGWVVYHDGRQLKEQLVDVHSIIFAGLNYGAPLDTLQVGKSVYTDQAYLFTHIPDELAGATYFRIPQNYNLGEDPSYFSEKQQMANYLEFLVTNPTHVYVALDAQVDDLPDWMQSGWQAVALRLETNDIPLRLYRKEYAKGALVDLVDRWMLDDRVPSQFIVIVAPASRREAQ